MHRNLLFIALSASVLLSITLLFGQTPEPQLDSPGIADAVEIQPPPPPSPAIELADAPADAIQPPVVPPPPAAAPVKALRSQPPAAPRPPAATPALPAGPAIPAPAAPPAIPAPPAGLQGIPGIGYPQIASPQPIPLPKGPTQLWPAGATFPTPLDEQSIKELQEFQQLEQQAAALARQYRELTNVQPLDNARLTDMKAKLAEFTKQAFDVRHKVQDRQVQNLRDRLKKVEENLAKRSESRDRIVSERVDELLGEGSNGWDSNPLGYGTSYGLPHVAGNRYPTASTAPAVSGYGGAPDYGAPGRRDPYATPPSPNAAVAGTPPANSALNPAAANALSPSSTPNDPNVTSSTARSARNSPRQESLETAYEKVLNELKELQRSPAGQSRERRIDEALQKLTAERKLFEFDIAEARLVLQAAEAKLDEAHGVNKRAPGTVPPPQLRTIQLERELAKIRLERLLHLHERYDQNKLLRILPRRVRSPHRHRVESDFGPALQRNLPTPVSAEGLRAAP